MWSVQILIKYQSFSEKSFVEIIFIDDSGTSQSFQVIHRFLHINTMQILHTSPRIYVYIYLYLYIYIFIYISIYPSIFLSICLYILLNTTLTADYRRNKNLKDNFVRAKMTEASLKNDSLNFRINNCNSKTYSWCKILVESKTFKGNTDNKVFKIQHNIVCHSNWLKYLCECKL